MYQERFYRKYSENKFKIEVSHKESDLFISSDERLDKKLCEDVLKKHYQVIEEYVKQNPQFATSLSPLAFDDGVPAVIQDMLATCSLTGIGPFASVAGAVAGYVGKELLGYAKEVMVENGGDLFLKINEDKRIGVYLGDNFSLQNITLKVSRRDQTFGIASSSATIGPSLNFGKADLLTVIAKDAIIADGFATALSNKIQDEESVNGILDFAKSSQLISGLLVFFQGKLFLWGDIEIEH